MLSIRASGGTGSRRATSSVFFPALILLLVCFAEVGASSITLDSATDTFGLTSFSIFSDSSTDQGKPKFRQLPTEEELRNTRPTLQIGNNRKLLMIQTNDYDGAGANDSHDPKIGSK